MNIKIRKFKEKDIARLVEILKLNNQYDFPEIEGPDAMKRVARCDAALLLVAVTDQVICGFIKAVYDGSRALIHLLSVDPDYQNSGVGMALVKAVSNEFSQRGAPTISATVTQKSAGFWKKMGFGELPVFVMLKDLE